MIIVTLIIAIIAIIIIVIINNNNNNDYDDHNNFAQSWTWRSRRSESAVPTAFDAKRRSKYKDLENNFHFEPVSMETLGGMGETTALFIKRLGKRIADGTGDILSVAYLRQRLAIACLLYTSPSPRDLSTSRMPSSA